MGQGATVAAFIEGLYVERKSPRVLHVGAVSDRLCDELEQKGNQNYLGTVTEEIETERSDKFYHTEDSGVIRANNAEVIVLENARIEEVRQAMNSGATFILFHPTLPFDYVNFLGLVAYKRGRRKNWGFQYRNLVHEGRSQNFIVLIREHEVQKAPRSYLSPFVPVKPFLAELLDAELSFVVLRWHEEIPFTSLDEDIDLLVADCDLEAIRNALDEKVGIVPFDLYSVSGMEGSGYEQMAYYPPHLAEKILENPVQWKSAFPIPDLRNYFLSLLYHAVYHKGLKSGFPLTERDKPSIEKADHDYPTLLYELSIMNSMEFEQLNLPYLHRFLKAEGWAPATDTIRKLSVRNTWLKTLEPEQTRQFVKSGELMTFVIRDWAVQNGKEEFIMDWLDKAGLKLVEAVHLDERQRKEAKQNIRGGNWGSGPWKVSGGEPAVLLVLYDYHPQKHVAKRRMEHPYVTNANYFLKFGLRDEINHQFAPEQRANAIHSSDDETEALEYIDAVAPELMPQIITKIMQWDQDYETEETVLGDLSELRRRAKVELIDFDGIKAVKKTYKAGNERFLMREKLVYGELGGESPYIPPLLDEGANYIITPYYETRRWTKVEKLKKLALKLRFKKDVLAITEFFYERGYALIDFHPGNLLLTDEGLKVIDFEFLYQYEQLPENSSESFDLLGFPEDFPEDRPFGIEGRQRVKMWRKILY
ncbi:hypothetical protein [Planomicrobium sp. YIM 101495]|uniref:hypothetical protein n=1 Tax=Planomicrobium sp. YIM 101495 TaxID=2665160 RepID=UPI0012B889C2|nr:hypothetical protein [Planomicrobium sp. YIM 101495]MTD30562.1 hypothetical protein [Planomicrobium sp. YIM 101495]